MTYIFWIYFRILKPDTCKSFFKSFDSIYRDSLWKILRHFGKPSKIVDLVKIFYTEFKRTIGNSSNTSLFVKSGVRQGCVMSALLFIIAVDWVMRSPLSEDKTGIPWTIFSSEDFEYADDLALQLCSICPNVWCWMLEDDRKGHKISFLKKLTVLRANS